MTIDKIISYDLKEIERALRIFIQPESVHEIRLLEVAGSGDYTYTLTGYFDYEHIEAAAKELANYSGKCAGCFITLNPVNAVLLARAANRLKKSKEATSAEDIIKREWIRIDIDPARPSGICATETEHDFALDIAPKIAEWLELQGISKDSLVIGDTGNGADIQIRVDLQNNEDSTQLVKSFLQVVANKFGNDDLVIDTSVNDPNRITKIYGTLNCKGDNTPDRPHRLARIIKGPETVQTADAEIIKCIAESLPKPKAGPKSEYRSDGRSLDLDKWMKEVGFDIEIKSVTDWKGGKKHVLRHCVFDSSHDRGESAIIVLSNGALDYHCFHQSCQGKEWHDVRELYEPAYREYKYNPVNTGGNGRKELLINIGPVNLTEATNGEAIASQWRHMIRFVFEWKSWVIYEGGRWAVDTTGRIRNLAVETMRRLYREGTNIEDLKKREKYAQWYISSENDRRITAAIAFALSQPGISITADTLDNQPWLLNVKNGTLELKTGVLREAKAEDLLTQQIDVDYEPVATSAEWEQFLKTIFNNNDKLIEYVQRSIGYTLNGTQLERVLFFLYGLGRNGKSQFMAALRRVLGPYADEAKPELFMEKRFAGTGPDEGQAALRGIRLLTATEVKRNQTLDTSLIKRMTGGEPIWHERKFQKGYSFYPSHKLWLSGNHEPKIKDTTDSIWDRLNKIPFECRIPEDSEVRGYGEKLAAQYPEAILNWCVKGAMAWNERGLTNPPECVLMANADYRARQDVLHDFAARLKKTPGEHTPVAEVYNAYKSFCQEDDTEPLGKQLFNEALRERGFKDKRGAGNKLVWLGVSYLVTSVTEKQGSLPTTRARDESLLKTDNKSNEVTENGLSQPQSGNSGSTSGELPDCPQCKECDWQFSPGAKKITCQKCGHIQDAPAETTGAGQ